MKKTFYILIQAALLTTGCCNTPADDPLSRTSDMAGWSIDVVAPGCVWYNYTGFYLPTGAQPDYQRPRNRPLARRIFALGRTQRRGRFAFGIRPPRGRLRRDQRLLFRTRRIVREDGREGPARRDRGQNPHPLLEAVRLRTFRRHRRRAARS